MSDHELKAIDWEKVLGKLQSEARQDVREAENALQRAKIRLRLLDAIAHHREKQAKVSD